MGEGGGCEGRSLVWGGRGGGNGGEEWWGE